MCDAYFNIAQDDILRSLIITMPLGGGVAASGADDASKGDDDIVAAVSRVCREMPGTEYHTDKDRIAITCLPTAVRGQILRLQTPHDQRVMNFCELFVYSGMYRCKCKAMSIINPANTN